jgi:bifunctional ADP-heptose synthase (sugar kinase/adenylyltransferase)
MIIESHTLSSLKRKVSMVDGSFDPLHEGHIEYFRSAQSIGHPVLCNIAPDVWTSSKHRVLISQAKRALIIDAIRYIDYVHIANTSTLEILEALNPICYVKGDDWLRKGGVPAAEKQLCDELGISIIYLDTVKNSSTKILKDYEAIDEGERS